MSGHSFTGWILSKREWDWTRSHLWTHLSRLFEDKENPPQHRCHSSWDTVWASSAADRGSIVPLSSRCLIAGGWGLLLNSGINGRDSESFKLLVKSTNSRRCGKAPLFSTCITPPPGRTFQLFWSAGSQACKLHNGTLTLQQPNMYSARAMRPPWAVPCSDHSNYRLTLKHGHFTQTTQSFNKGHWEQHAPTVIHTGCRRRSRV